jgi:hypothetical protein
MLVVRSKPVCPGLWDAVQGLYDLKDHALWQLAVYVLWRCRVNCPYQVGGRLDIRLRNVAQANLYSPLLERRGKRDNYSLAYPLDCRRLG